MRASWRSSDRDCKQIGPNPFLTPFNVFGPLTSCLTFGVHSSLSTPCPAQHWRDPLRGAGSYFLPVLAAAFFAHGLALHFNAMSVMDEPVEDAIGDGRISDLGMPSANWQLAGQHRRSHLIARGANFQKVAA